MKPINQCPHIMTEMLEVNSEVEYGDKVTVWFECECVDCGEVVGREKQVYVFDMAQEETI